MNVIKSYIIYRVTTATELGNQTSEVFQVDLAGLPGVGCGFWVHLRLAFTDLSSVNGGYPNVNASTTSYFVARTLHATTAPLYLSTVQDEQITNVESLSNNSKEAKPWTIWSPSNTTELIQMACTYIGLFIVY